MRLKDPERCRHPAERRQFRPSVFQGEQIVVEACLDCGIEMLHPADSARLLAKAKRNRKAQAKAAPARVSSR